MTNTPDSLTRILVPYDGSEPAVAALDEAIAFAGAIGALTIVTVVNETALIAQTAADTFVYDATPYVEAIDAQGRAYLADASERCRAAGRTNVTTELLHNATGPAILAACEKYEAQMIVMGTHARTGVARTFLGSTTEEVLRKSNVPVLTVRSGEHASALRDLTMLVAVDESDPSDAAVDLAAEIATTRGGRGIICTVVDTRRTYELARQFGYDPRPPVNEMHDKARLIARSAIDRAARHGAEFREVEEPEGEATTSIIEAAHRHDAGLIVIGTHGRRGIQHLFLGSVAEGVVRHSDVPVLVVRSGRI